MKNRLQQKCVIASAGFHLLLGLVLVISSAFLAPSGKSTVAASNRAGEHPILVFERVDDRASGGDSGAGNPLSAASQSISLAPNIPAIKPAEQVRQADPIPASFEPGPRPKSRVISTNIVIRRQDRQILARDNRDIPATGDAEWKRTAAGQALKAIGEGMSSSVPVSFHLQGNGLPSVDFLQQLKAIYEAAWLVPDGATDDNTTAASVTIARDGTVIRSRITRSSGNADVDASVRKALDSVRTTVPLSDSSDNQQIIEINFSVKAKRGLG
jgi:TonB family protein